MNFWAGLFIGWITCNLYFGIVIDGLRWIGARVAVGRRRRSWRIRGVVYRVRPLTRAVLEQIVALQTLPNPVEHPVIALMTGADRDPEEMRSERIRNMSEATDSMYACCRLLLTDRNGDSPPADAVDELPIDEVNAVVACIGGIS